MNRREFLKVSGLSTAVLLMRGNRISLRNLMRPALIKHQDMLFHGTPHGEILMSRDLGKTWQIHTRLGKEYSVLNFSKDASHHLHARIVFAGREFDLTLAQGNKYWLCG